MKRLLKPLLPAVLMLLAAGVMAQSGKKTIYVADVLATDALKATVAGDARGTLLARVTQGIDEHLISALAASRKFTVVERSAAMETLIKEQDLAEAGVVARRGAQSNALTGAENIVIVSLDAFQRTIDTLVVRGITRAKCRLQASVQMRIVDASTGEILDASNLQAEKMEIMDLPANSNDPAGRFDSMIPQFTRELAEKSVKRLLAVLFPAKIIDVDEEIVTINRGEGFFAKGDVVKLFAKGRTITDPDTGEKIVIKGRSAGTLRIVSVEPNYSQGELMDGAKVAVGAQVELPE